MKLLEIFPEVVASLVDVSSTDLDCCLVMFVLHTYQIRLRPTVVLEDAILGDGLVSSLTKLHAASLVAARFSGGSRRGDRYFWLEKYSGKTPFEFHDELPSGLQGQVDSIREKAAEHPLVLELVPAKW